MIYTITFNPSLDYLMYVNNFEDGETNRSFKEEIYPGGKGFNVSTILWRLNLPTTALGFIAGFTGQEIQKQLLKRGFNCDLCTLDNGMSRINVKLKSQVETEINGSGPDIPKDKIEETVPAVNYAERNTAKPKVKVEKPQVVIPVFPGTNCEVDSARAFERAGAIADIHIINTLSEESLNASIRELAEKIKKANIIFIPGGFSGGDEPDGSAKFITAVFRNPLVSEAVTDLLDNRDGLIIGICNGFQALIKLGLVPYGKITEPDENSPTLTYNRIGRHASCLVRTRVGSVKSPWLSESEVGDIYTIPVSHGEGNFICDEKLLNQLIENGQVVTQYVDFDGNPSMDIKYNPNHSVMAVEGICSPDGRVFGKMGHSERIGKSVFVNVPGEKDMKLFEAAVKYFRD